MDNLDRNTNNEPAETSAATAETEESPKTPTAATESAGPPPQGDDKSAKTPSKEDNSTQDPHDKTAAALHELAEIRHDPNAIRASFESGKYPYRRKLQRSVYEKQKANLQVELLKAQRWIKEQGEKVVILFEGRDAAGKGGTIKRFMEHLNPRGARVIALEKPSEEEKGQWFFQRYIENLPTAGELVMFDR